MTEAYRRFMAFVDAFVDEMSEKCAAEIEKEAKDAGCRAKAGGRLTAAPPTDCCETLLCAAAARRTASARIQGKAIGT